MNSQIKDKKEQEGTVVGTSKSGIKGSGEIDESLELEQLPPDIEALVLGRHYQSEKDLIEAFAKLGIHNLKFTKVSFQSCFMDAGFTNLSFEIVDGGKPRLTKEALENTLIEKGYYRSRIDSFNGKPYLLKLSKEHARFIGKFSFRFNNSWCYGTALASCFAARPPVLYGRYTDGKERHSSFACWGRGSCILEDCEGKDYISHIDFDVLPDIVFKFSWKNILDYEREVMDDIMTGAMDERTNKRSTNLPRLGFLIKMHLNAEDKAVGLDIWRFEYGQTMNEAEHSFYERGLPDVPIIIKPRHLDLEPEQIPEMRKVGDGWQWMTASEILGMYE